MSVRLRSPALLALVFVTSTCVKKSDVPGETPADPPRQAERAELPEQPVPSIIHPLVGEWVLAMQAATGVGPGFRLSLTVDSGTAEVFHGRVSHFFSGNVGIDPAAFLPFQGMLFQDGVIDIPVRPASGDASPLHFVGRLSVDTIRIATFTIGQGLRSSRL
jgi:hypothetical protein